MKQTDYTGKCGTCAHFERNGEYRSGWCHAQRFDADVVVCDLEHPYPVYGMSRIKCTKYKEGQKMIKTFCDYCGKEIKDANHQVNFDINAYGCSGFFPKEYNYHVECGRKIEGLIQKAAPDLKEEPT